MPLRVAWLLHSDTRFRFLGSIPGTSRDRHCLPNYSADSRRFAMGFEDGFFRVGGGGGVCARGRGEEGAERGGEFRNLFTSDVAKWEAQLAFAWRSTVLAGQPEREPTIEANPLNSKCSQQSHSDPLLRKGNRQTHLKRFTLSFLESLNRYIHLPWNPLNNTQHLRSQSFNDTPSPFKFL